MKRGKTYEWIPLWVEKWLWGSTRIELNPAERSVWVDLMVLGSKDDGYVRANTTTPYQDQQLAGMLCIEIELLQSTITKCIHFGKLEKDEYGCLHIVNWETYSLGERYKRKLMADESAPKGRIRGPVSTSMSIVFNIKRRVWEGITDEDKKSWAETFPACDIELELKKAGQWLIDNPNKKKSAYRRYVFGWLNRTQNAGGTKGATALGRRSAADQAALDKWAKDE